MLGRTAVLFASCALGASAFLLPPGISATDNDKTGIFDVVSLDPKNRLLQLPCSSCAFPAKKNEISETEEGDGLFWAQGGANNLLLNFTITEDDTTLLLNGQPLYPYNIISELRKMESDWVVEQIPASVKLEDIASGDYHGTPLQITGAGVGSSPVQALESDGDEVIPIKWQLLSLENQQMTVDEVFIQLLHTKEGELLILSVEQIPGSMLDNLPLGPSGPSHNTSPEGCKSLPGPLCDLKNWMQSATKGLKHGKFGGCAGRKGGNAGKHLPSHIKTHFGPPGQDGWKDRPQHGGPHGHHGHHGHHRHSVFHAISKGILAILIPIMAGVTVGMTVSILGLLVGRFIGWFWFVVVRGGKRGYASVSQDDGLIGDEDLDKTTNAAEDVEALPRYEDAPAYEEVQKDQK